MRTDGPSSPRSDTANTGAPRLVAISPPPMQGAVVDLVAARVVVGRSETSDHRLDNETLSRTHAAIDRSTGRTVVSDLHSTNGTFVNEARVGEQGRPLGHGDVLRLGEIELRYEEPPAVDATRPVPVSAASRPQSTEYHIEQQRAGEINNVGRDQHKYYQYVEQQRESFARDIAGTKTKARRLIWVGFALLAVGLAVYFTMFVSAFKTLSNANAGDPSVLDDFWGPKLGGVPVGIYGFALAGIGSILMMVGIVLHVVAAARKRKFEGNLPPPPWAAVPPARWSA